MLSLEAVVVINPHHDPDLHQLAQRQQWREIDDELFTASQGYGIKMTAQGLGLVNFALKNAQPVVVNFESGKANHRRHFGGGKGQMIAKAVGVSSRFKPRVLDATAGLAADAFVLASLGCSVTLLERNPAVQAVLADGIARAIGSADADVVAIVERMTLRCEDSINYLQALANSPEKADVIYIDPMFPERKKNAAVKKEMQLFHGLVGADEDQQQLLLAAQAAATYRVVVKRPRLADAIGGLMPSYQLTGKTSRYDIYTLRKLP